MNKFATVLFAFAFIGAAFALNSSAIFLGEEQATGFVNLSGDKGDIFYWYFPSRSSPDDPLVFWLTGGPGCSSVVALFSENGPFTVNDDLSLKRNEFSWSDNSNIVFVDQPRGTGFSAAKGGYDTDENQIAADFYEFLVGFMDRFPQYKGKGLFITGESYAGHYIPRISSFIVKKGDANIKLLGSAIGNGLVDPYQQYPQYANFALENKLVNEATFKILQGAFALCQGFIKSKVWPLAMYECQMATTMILGLPVAPRFNVYDIRKKCDVPPLCYDFSNIDKFLARPEVRAEIGVGDRPWQACNMVVHTFLMGDWMTELTTDVEFLLKSGVHVLVYSGDKDFICNWRGGEAWTHEMPWEHQAEFKAASYKDWVYNSKTYGQSKTVDNLTFLRVYDAGHMVPMDQPEAALGMLKKFFHNWDAQFKLSQHNKVEA